MAADELPPLPPITGPTVGLAAIAAELRGLREEMRSHNELLWGLFSLEGEGSGLACLLNDTLQELERLTNAVRATGDLKPVDRSQG